MTPQQITKFIDHELTSFEYEEPVAGSTIGVPWSEAKVRAHIAKLKDALVTPYKQRFELRDTFEQLSISPPDEADYWVVAKAEYYLEFYDPFTNEFGLAGLGTEDSLPVTIGVRGDLIGTFCAM